MAAKITCLHLYWRRALLITTAALVVFLGTLSTISLREKIRVQSPSPRNLRSLLSTRVSSSSLHVSQLQVQQVYRESEDRRLDERCSCRRGGNFGSTRDLSNESLKVRDYVYKKWQERQQLLTPRPPLGLCPAYSPLQFVSSGIEIEPLQSVAFVGLQAPSLPDDASHSDESYKLTFTSLRGLGVLSLVSGINVDVTGSGTKVLTLFVPRERDLLNTALKGVVYRSTVAVVDEWDTVTIDFSEKEISIHIHIRRERLPFLYKISSTSPPIHERVTVVVKTFERYDKVNTLIDSVLKFYPAMTILVADDSVHFQAIDKRNVYQYKMPPVTGWFAGRNLLVSQVTTEYFVWTDDDFIFSADTKLELFMEKLDKVKLKLDLVAGHVDEKGFGSACLEVNKDKEGMCVALIKNDCHRGHLDGYPQCVLSDRPVNFFMARTRSIQKVGFDPSRHLRHTGHNQVFMDGYHTLTCASCKDVSVGHIRGGGAFYQKHRSMNTDKQEEKEKREFHAFKYNLKCMDI